MLHQPFTLNFNLFRTNHIVNNPSARSLLLDIVHKNHLLFYMEKRDRPNNLIRLLVELYKLGASKDQLDVAYQRNMVDVESIKTITTAVINEDNWRDYLGNGSFYKEYLLFFDRQLQELGVQETLNRYFYSMTCSIGSQLQPIVQLSFGIEEDLPEIISQALAYYACSYLDVSNILEYCDNQQSPSTQSFDHELVNKMLFGFVRADPRFDGKIEGPQNTLQSSIKVLLKSQSNLLGTYMKTWSGYSVSASERLDMLIYTALTLVKVSSRQLENNGPIEMDWFLAGGQLLESALAIKKMALDEEHLETLVNVQFLSTLCTFVVQGRPMNKHMPKYRTSNVNIQEIVRHAFSDAKLMLTVSGILKVQQLYPEYNDLCLDTLQLLEGFSKNGAWVKCGLGW